MKNNTITINPVCKKIIEAQVKTMINNSIADQFTKCPSWILTIQTFVQL